MTFRDRVRDCEECLMSVEGTDKLTPLAESSKGVE